MPAPSPSARNSWIMQVAYQIVHLNKRLPLRISRGVSTGSDNLFVSITQDGVTGLGEMAPATGDDAAAATAGEAALREFFTPDLQQLAIHEIHARGLAANVPSSALAALDVALWDWLAKRARLPLHRLLGLGRPTAVTSVTVGINPPDIAREHTRELIEDGRFRSLKIKLGSPDGAAADQAMFAAVAQAAEGSGMLLRVDANGGWDVATARRMMAWLAERGVAYVEQPLKRGEEDRLPELFKDRALPIFVDESCRLASDIPKWADAVDGVNLKLMKCGGITEALRIVAVARAFGLQTMIGCMSETSVAISAGAAIGALFNHIDLDSHTNLAPDPATGAQLVDGVVMPPDVAGHGATLNESTV